MGQLHTHGIRRTDERRRRVEYTDVPERRKAQRAHREAKAAAPFSPHPALLCGSPAWAIVLVAHFQPFVRLTACEVAPPSE